MVWLTTLFPARQQRCRPGKISSHASSQWHRCCRCAESIKLNTTCGCQETGESLNHQMHANLRATLAYIPSSILLAVQLTHPVRSCIHLIVLASSSSLLCSPHNGHHKDSFFCEGVCWGRYSASFLAELFLSSADSYIFLPAHEGTYYYYHAFVHTSKCIHLSQQCTICGMTSGSTMLQNPNCNPSN